MTALKIQLFCSKPPKKIQQSRVLALSFYPFNTCWIERFVLQHVPCVRNRFLANRFPSASHLSFISSLPPLSFCLPPSFPFLIFLCHTLSPPSQFHLRLALPRSSSSSSSTLSHLLSHPSFSQSLVHLRPSLAWEHVQPYMVREHQGPLVGRAQEIPGND